MQELGCGGSRCDERDSYDFHGPLTHSRHDNRGRLVCYISYTYCNNMTMLYLVPRRYM